MLNIGNYYETKNYGKIQVLNHGAKSDFYTVQFVDTGTIKECRGWQITEGCVRDPYARKVCGVGCTGNIRTKGKYKIYYAIWHDMINRCYNPKNREYHNYNDVTVSEDWLIFENFYRDALTLDGYDKDLIEKGLRVLDKDFKQRFSNAKVYSKRTCMWLDKSVNNIIQDKQQIPFIAISPTGQIYKAYNITQFAREHSLSRRHISGVLHKRTHSTAGWKFQYDDSYKNIV